MKRLLVPLAAILTLVLTPTVAHAQKPVKSIQFSTTSFFANETDVSAVITLTRTWSSGTASVRMSTGGGTASGSTDYSGFTNRLVTFAKGMTTVNTQVTLVDDGVYDETPAETATLTLSSPAKGSTLGSPSTATLTITDTDPPAAPVISATAGGDDGEIDLSWAAVPGATNYNLYRGTVSGTYPAGPFPTGGAISVTDSGLVNSVTYYYVVQSVGTYGTSSNSNEASAVAPGTPPPPTELIANGDFETGDFTSWTVGTTDRDPNNCGPNSDEACSVPPPLPAITGTAYDGSYAAYLGTPLLALVEPVGDSYITQTFTVPSTGTTSLSVWVKTASEDISTVFDGAQVLLVDDSTNTTVTVLTTIADADWAEFTADLTPYAGTTFRLVINVYQDNANDPTEMWVDDVSVVNAIV